MRTRKKPRTAGGVRRQPSKSKTTKTALAEQAERAAVEEPRDTASEPPFPPIETAGDLDEGFESAPERVFAARLPSPPPERPLPSTRRAIFFDVENSSRPEHVARVVDHLAIDRLGRTTEIVAVGNWKVIGHDTARLLARHGAHLIHSAPSSGVRDWSDLRIAVSAGIWVATARPGDILEIVSDDRAFDAVGDVAASLGVAFGRLSYRGLGGIAGDAVVVLEQPAPESRSRRRRRGGRRGRSGPPPVRSHPVVVMSPPPTTIAANGTEPRVEPHTAPHDEIVAVVRDLLGTSTGGVVSIDTLANALKRKGFRRPPGSLRLITRLRRIKELVISPSGMIALGDSRGPGAGEPAVAVASNTDPANGLPTAPDDEMAARTGQPAGPADAAAVTTSAPRRRSRRGGRRRRSRGREPAAV